MSNQLLTGRKAANLFVKAGVVCLLAFLGLYNQPYYPISWQDEGFVLQGAMNLVKYGKYAMLSSEGFRVLDQPLIANGPGVVLPIAAAFSGFGIGLLQARVVIWLYFLWGLVMFYVLAKRLTSNTAAWISTLILLSATDQGFLYYGRIAMGNMPALAYLLTGFVFLLEWIHSQKFRFATLAGLFFGISVVTKSQMALIIPALILSALITRLYYKKVNMMGYMMIIMNILVCMLIWYIGQYLIVGRENFAEHLAAIQSSSRVTILVLNLERVPRNIWQFIISGMPLYFVPGLLWAIWSLREKTLESVSRLPFIILTVIWLLWFVFFSIGWHRYFFEPSVIGMLFSGQLIIDALHAYKTNPRISVRMATLGLVGIFVIATVVGLGGNVRQITARPDTSLQQFAEYLSRNVPPEAVVESWEWQIDPLVNLNFHHPTNDWVDRMTAWLTFGKAPEQEYIFSEYSPQFLIDGPFSIDTGIYQQALQTGNFVLLYSLHPYYLYRVKSP